MSAKFTAVSYIVGLIVGLSFTFPCTKKRSFNKPMELILDLHGSLSERLGRCEPLYHLLVNSVGRKPAEEATNYQRPECVTYCWVGVETVPHTHTLVLSFVLLSESYPINQTIV